MKIKDKITPGFWMAFAAMLAICAASWLRLFNSYELITYDLRFKLRQPLPVSDDIAIIQISDDTLANLGAWPIPRDFHASLLDVLREFKVRKVVFDLLFSEATAYDDVLAKSMDSSAGLCLPVAFYIPGDPKKYSPYLSGKSLLADVCPGLKPHASGMGHINAIVDPDGKARRVPLFIEYNGEYFPHLGFRAAADCLGLSLKNAEFKSNRVIIDKKLSLPLAFDGSFLVNYPAKWGSSYRNFSYFEILKAYSDMKEGGNPQLDLSVLKDKICFIGLTATGTSDLRAMPLENVYPMVGLQASVFNSIMTRKFINDAGRLLNTLINILVFILSLTFCLRFSPLKSFVANALLAVVFSLAACGLFAFCSLWIDCFLPLCVIILVYAGTTCLRLLSEVKRRLILEKELEIAQDIQRCFLPEVIKEFRGLNISAFLKPAKLVAGDLYDILVLGEQKIGVFIADVAGKGVPAALIMAQTISLFRIFAREYPDCAEVLAHLNKELCGRFPGRFVTGIYMIIDASAKSVELASAGHSPSLLYRMKDNAVSEEDFHTDVPLGIDMNAQYIQTRVDIAKGDKIIVFTDGLFEARDTGGREYGLLNTKKIILDNARMPAGGLLELITGGLFKFSKGAQQHDDITVILVDSRGD